MNTARQTLTSEPVETTDILSSYCANLEVAKLPSVTLPPQLQLPKTRAVYFALGKKGQVLYVGRATSLSGRWLNHHKRAELDRMGGVRVAWLEVADGVDLITLEAELIDRFQPPLNIQSGWSRNNGTSSYLRGVKVDGKKLADARVEAGLSQEEVGEAVGLTRQGLSKVEQTGNTSSHIFVRLLTLYGLDIEQVITREN